MDPREGESQIQGNPNQDQAMLRRKCFDPAHQQPQQSQQVAAQHCHVVPVPNIQPMFQDIRTAFDVIAPRPGLMAWPAPPNINLCLGEEQLSSALSEETSTEDTSESDSTLGRELEARFHFGVKKGKRGKKVKRCTGTRRPGRGGRHGHGGCGAGGLAGH